MPTPDVVSQLARQFFINEHTLRFRQTSREEFSVDLAKECVLAAGFQKPWQDEWGDAFPDATTLTGAQQLFDAPKQWWRQLPEHPQMTAADHSDLNIPGATFGPRSPKSSDGTLRGVS